MSSASRSHVWLYAGASVPGVVHEQTGKLCEDVWAVEVRPSEAPEVFAIALSDGAGGARFGHLGALLSVKWASRTLVEEFKELMAADALEARLRFVGRLRRILLRRARKARENLREFACTLIALAVDSAGQWIMFHIGDGGVVAQVDDELTILSAPQKGEFVNQTFFVTDDDSVQHVHLLRHQPGTTEPLPRAFALFTDGIENLLINEKNGKVAPVFTKLFDWTRTLPKDVVEKAIYENLHDVFRPRSSTGDDCTLVVLVRRSLDTE